MKGIVIAMKLEMQPTQPHVAWVETLTIATFFTTVCKNLPNPPHDQTDFKGHCYVLMPQLCYWVNHGGRPEFSTKVGIQSLGWNQR